MSLLNVYVLKFGHYYMYSYYILLLCNIKLDKLDVHKLLSSIYLLNDPIDEEMLSFALNNT